MLKTVLRLLAADPHQTLRFVDDQRGCPTFADDLASMLVRLAVERRGGLYHVTNQGAVSWFEFVRAIAAAAGHDPARVEPISSKDLDPPRPAPRPANSVLDNLALRCAGIPLLPHWHTALERTIRALDV
jgi:dTDP-4-dehydrorhamnose reductase